MEDIIARLGKRRIALIARRESLIAEHRRQVDAMDQEIEDLETAIKVVKTAVSPYLCKKCGGTGVHRYCDAAGDMDDEPCPKCHGTGISIAGGVTDDEKV